MEFTKDPIFEEESKVSAKRALYKDVHRLLVEVPGYDTYSQQFWSDANRFIFMRPTFLALQYQEQHPT